MTQITDDKTIRDIVVKVLDEHPDFEPCLIVKEQVEEWMKYLQDKDVLEST